MKYLSMFFTFKLLYFGSNFPHLKLIKRGVQKKTCGDEYNLLDFTEVLFTCEPLFTQALT